VLVGILLQQRCSPVLVCILLQQCCTPVLVGILLQQRCSPVMVGILFTREIHILALHLLVEESGVHGESHRPVASHCQILSHIVVSSTHRLSEGMFGTINLG
jgi:hypothetical protein